MNLICPNSALGNNESVHEEENPLACPKCSATFKYQQGLKTHIAGVHEGKKYPCPMCSSELTQKSGLNRHIAVVHKGKKFTQKDSLNSHEERKDM